VVRLGLVAAAVLGGLSPQAQSLVFANSGSLAPAVNKPETSENHIAWRSKRVCGLNCVYFLLRAEGKNPDYALMQQGLLKEAFTSLADLKRVAADYGLSLRLAQMTPEELRQIDKPVVAHFDIVDVRGSTQGHFVVVTHADENGVELVDGTTVLTRSIPWREFQRTWSGYVAHRAPSTLGTGWQVLVFVIGLGSGWLIDRFLQRRRYFVRSV